SRGWPRRLSLLGDVRARPRRGPWTKPIARRSSRRRQWLACDWSRASILSAPATPGTPTLRHGVVHQQGWKRRGGGLLVTTKTLEAAIAAPAMSGLRSPMAASGMAATLEANAKNRSLDGAAGFPSRSVSRGGPIPLALWRGVHGLRPSGAGEGT